MKNTNDATSKGKQASVRGFANESRLLAALTERNYIASRVDSPLSTYDIVVERAPDDMIRVQVKTVSPNKRVSFVGGSRGGVDRDYKSGVKTYIQNTETSDIVVGVESVTINGDSKTNFYFIPTLFIEAIGQGSLSTNKISQAKNDWEILERCKEADFVNDMFDLEDTPNQIPLL